MAIKDLEKEEDKVIEKVLQTQRKMEAIDEEKFRIRRADSEIESNFRYIQTMLNGIEYYPLSGGDWQRMLELRQRQQYRQYEIQDHLADRLRQANKSYREQEDELEYLSRKRWQISDQIEKERAKSRRF